MLRGSTLGDAIPLTDSTMIGLPTNLGMENEKTFSRSMVVSLQIYNF